MIAGLLVSAVAAVLVLWLPAWTWISKRLHGEPVRGLDDDDDLMALNDAVELEVCEALWALPERSQR